MIGLLTKLLTVLTECLQMLPWYPLCKGQSSAKIAKKKLEPSQPLAAPLPHKLTHFRTVPHSQKKLEPNQPLVAAPPHNFTHFRTVPKEPKNSNQVSHLLHHYHTS